MLKPSCCALVLLMGLAGCDASPGDRVDEAEARLLGSPLKLEPEPSLNTRLVHNGASDHARQPFSECGYVARLEDRIEAGLKRRILSGCSIERLGRGQLHWRYTPLAGN